MISIKEICDKYRIKQATAYKWRSYLRDNSISESWENYDRINNREINLSQSAQIVPMQEQAITAEPVMQTSKKVEVSESGNFGLSIGRLQELNSEAELEVLVKSKLRDYHESRLQSQRSQELKSKIAEVGKLDPKNLGAMLSGLGFS